MPGDWSVRRPDAGTRRVGLRVRQRQLPRHRRHRRGGPGPPPSAAPSPAADDACDRAVALDPGHAVPRRRLGRLRRRQRQRSGRGLAVLRLRGGDRPPFRRRHRPRHRDARRRVDGCGRPLPGPCSGSGRSRKPTARGSDAGASTTCTGRGPPCRRWWRRVSPRRPADPPRRRLARGAPERGRRLGRGPPLVRRSRVGGVWRVDGVPDGVGPPGLAGGRSQ